MAGKTKKPNAQLIRELRLEIDRLKHELGRYRKKVADDAARLKKLSEDLEKYDWSYLQMAADRAAFIATATMQYGWPAKDDCWELALPVYDYREIAEAYEVTGTLDEERNEYRFRVKRKEGPADAI